MIFISHRHDDIMVANVFNRHFQMWGISQNEIFQSSDGGDRSIGDTLTEALRVALSNPRIVLLIYTSQEKDWSWCMYECGVATNPDDNTENTKVIVFRTGKDVPAVFEHKMIFGIDEEAITEFTTQFHTKKGFFREDVAFIPNISPAILKEFSFNLHEDLIRWAPCETEERYRWDCLILKLDADLVRQIKEEHNIESGSEIVLKKATVEGDFGDALTHFNYVRGTHGLKLIKLISRWEKDISSLLSNAPKKWVQELCAEIVRAVKNKPPEPIWSLIRSYTRPNSLFYPVVNYAKVEMDSSMYFQIFIYRLPG